MKIATAIMLIMAFATIAFAVDPPKDIDNMDYIMDAPSRIVIDGELTLNSPTWHRWRGASFNEIGLNCDLLMTYEYATDPHFDMFCFNVTDTNPVEFVVTAGSFDTVIYIYCDPFDPANSTVNAVYADDDDGVGLLSAITAANGVTLNPGADYWFIICSYSTTVGTFSVQTSDNVSLCDPVANETTDFGTLKSYFK